MEVKNVKIVLRVISVLRPIYPLSVQVQRINVETESRVIQSTIQYVINNSAIDSELCEILKSKIKKYIEMTVYLTNPTYPRFFGKVESLHFQRKAPIMRERFASTDLTALPNSRNTGTPTSIRNAVTTTLINQNG